MVTEPRETGRALRSKAGRRARGVQGVCPPQQVSKCHKQPNIQKCVCVRVCLLSLFQNKLANGCIVNSVLPTISHFNICCRLNLQGSCYNQRGSAKPGFVGGGEERGAGLAEDFQGLETSLGDLVVDTRDYTFVQTRRMHTAKRT